MVGSIKGLVVAAVIVMPGAGVASVAPPPENPQKPVTQPAKTHAPEDYWKPLDTWLKAQGSPLSGKDFYEVGAQYKIDPDFLIAVTKAETDLGKVKQRGSTYNIGSVCSHDSTSTTCQASSYRQGIEMIAQTTNNQYLRRYDKVSQLSRAHNPNQAPVYATSGHNWNANVIGTMNQLKNGKELDYIFRR